MTERSTVNVRLLFFAKTRELSGVKEAQIELQSDIVAEKLLDHLCAAYNLSIIKQNVILAINERYCDNLQELLHLREGDEIAVIPPISGG